MTVKAIIFDLDGTLLNTLDDLADSMNRVLMRLGFPTHPTAAYKYFVGDGIEKLASRVLPEAQRNTVTVKICVEEMQQEYGEHWRDKTCPYAGINDMLQALTKRGISLNILSNKPDALTQLTVASFFPSYVFANVAGAKKNTPKKPDPTSALHIVKSLVLSADQFLYLGDTSTDMETAKNAGILALGALWGFRTASELQASGAQDLLEHPLDILQHI
ncbi:MAG: HAD family hydrolase [Desulfurivibrio sp.]|jgi:phosphoglycolate phosphatase|nr:MAG: HAD family hydrolase [Desulfurivibrio sp.]